MKLFVLINIFFLFCIISSGQEVINDNFDAITFENPLKEVLYQYFSEIHKESKEQALILLTLNQLDENKQIYRISTFRSELNIDLPSIIRFGKLENDIVFFSISYNRQLFNGVNFSIEKILKNLESSNLCKSNEYWEVTIVKDKSYQIDKKVKGHQTYRQEKKIHYVPTK